MADISTESNGGRQSDDESLATGPATATESAVESLAELEPQTSIPQTKPNQQTRLRSSKKNTGSQIRLTKN